MLSISWKSLEPVATLNGRWLRSGFACRPTFQCVDQSLLLFQLELRRLDLSLLLFDRVDEHG